MIINNPKERLLNDIEYAIKQFRITTHESLSYEEATKIILYCIDAFLPRGD